MFAWTEPYEDEYIKEHIEDLKTAQKEAIAQGKVLVFSYEQFWLRALNDLPDVEFNPCSWMRWSFQIHRWDAQQLRV